MENKRKYYLQIADNALILSHRLSEYCSHAPFLEEDLANTNVALDLIGTAESIYVKLAEIEGVKNSDDFAYRRKESEFLNCLLVEQPNADFAHIMVRQFLIDSFNFYFYSKLAESKDAFLRALALKTIKEVTYHLRRSSEWLIRLGDGTQEANDRTQAALNHLWKYSHELFETSEVDQEMISKGIGVDLAEIKPLFIQKVNEICYMANLKLPDTNFKISGGKSGKHSEYLGHILCEMQFLPSKYPDAVW
ncbi:MAG: 1,2-phenylacetyl-CoA epoxidase subunit PaaC [Flavobacteriia bacterium]|jgi:ring-1,2-phenylacetyl-CoA epoxidase subunit PaaC